MMLKQVVRYWERAPTFETPVLSETTTYYVEDLVNFDGGLFSVGQENHTGGSQYAGSNDYNGTLEFDVEQEFTLQSVNVITDMAGIRRIVLLDNNGDEVASHEEDCAIGLTTVELNWVIQPGTDYVMTTDIAVNVANLGFEGPRFMRSSGGVDFPYEVEDVVSINNTSAGMGYYYYFYNWQILKAGVDCVSDRSPVVVTFDPNSGTADLLTDPDGMELFPNPLQSDLLTLEFQRPLDSDAVVSILGNDGRMHLQQELANGTEALTLEIPALPAGFYIVEVRTDQVKFVRKLIRL